MMFSRDEADSILERWDQTEPAMQRQIVLAFAAENTLLQAVADSAARLIENYTDPTRRDSLELSIAALRRQRNAK